VSRRSSGPFASRVTLLLIAAAGLLAGACSSSSTHSKTSAEMLLNERMAAVLLRDGRFADAENAYRDVIKYDNHNPDLYDGLGVALLAQGKTKESLDALDHAVKLSPDKSAYRIHRAIARTEAEQYKGADEDFQRADASDVPEDKLEIAINRGRLRQRQGDFARAEEEFTTALAYDAKSAPARLGRGVAREAKGDLSGAAEDYLEAVKLDPKNATANLRLGLVLVNMKKYNLGRRYLERAVELDPGGDIGSKAQMLLDSTPQAKS
jgi:tetratricopeptide (TPR) repeat protein